jgi:hypothetical protein
MLQVFSLAREEASAYGGGLACRAVATSMRNSTRAVDVGVQQLVQAHSIMRATAREQQAQARSNTRAACDVYGQALSGRKQQREGAGGAHEQLAQARAVRSVRLHVGQARMSDGVPASGRMGSGHALF